VKISQSVTLLKPVSLEISPTIGKRPRNMA
jgi:hypothetical protein